MIKLPEPAMKTHGPFDTTEKLWFNEAQMLQFRRDALEEAANTVLNLQSGWIPDGFTECATAIRKLKDET